MNPLPNGQGQCTACHSLGGIVTGVNAAPNLAHFADPDAPVLRRMRLG